MTAIKRWVGSRRLTSLAISTVLLLTACSGSAQESVSTDSSSSSPESELEIVTIWLETNWGNELIEAFQNEVVDTFNQQNEAINLQADVKENIGDALRIALSAGSETPDLVLQNGPVAAVSVASAGQLLPLDSYVDEYNWDELLVPWAIAVSTVGDHQYCIPGELETLALYYNKTLFDEHGWEMPTTYAEFKELAGEISAAGLIPFAHGNADYQLGSDWYVVEYLNHIAGPEAVRAALRGEIPWTDPKIEQSLQELVDTVQAGWFMGSLDRYYTTTYAEADAALASGEAAMMLNGTWGIPALLAAFDETGQEMDWVPMPSSDGTPILNISAGDCIAINANSKYPDAAAEFLDWYLSPAGQLQVAKAGLSPNPTPPDSQVMAQYDPVRGAVLEQLLDLSSKPGQYGYTDWTFFPPKMDAYWQNHIEQMWAGSLTVAEYLQEVQATWEEDKADGTLLPVP